MCTIFSKWPGRQTQEKPAHDREEPDGIQKVIHIHYFNPFHIVLIERSLRPMGGTVTHIEMMHGQTYPPSNREVPLKLPFPVVQFKPNVYGIRGLGGNVSEWGLSLRMGPSPKKDAQYVIPPGAIARQPWEAFEEVSFRTSLSIPKEGT
jgi:hypothetical protein